MFHKLRPSVFSLQSICTFTMNFFRRKKTKIRKSKTPLKWFVIISIVVAVMAAVLGVRGGVIDFIEHYFGYKDNSYRPVDPGYRDEDNKRD